MKRVWYLTLGQAKEICLSQRSLSGLVAARVLSVWLMALTRRRPQAGSRCWLSDRLRETWSGFSDWRTSRAESTLEKSLEITTPLSIDKSRHCCGQEDS